MTTHNPIKRSSMFAAVFLISIVLVLGFTILRLKNIQPDIATDPENLVDFRTVELVIETDKDEYEFGEFIEASIYVVNPTSETVWIRPIANYGIRANSVYDPDPSTISVSKSYPAGSYIKIDANGRYSIDHQAFKTKYPGPFTIDCMGMKKTVNVTGYRWESLDSDGIHLELEPVQYPSIYMGYIDSMNILVVNEYQYEVRLAHPVTIEYGFEPNPDNITGIIMYDLIDFEYNIPANSTYILGNFYIRGECGKAAVVEVQNHIASYYLWCEG